MQKYKTAWELVRERTRAQDRRLQRVKLPAPKPTSPTTARRLASDVPYTPPAISIMKPVPDDAMTIKRFVGEQFAEAQRKRRKRA